MNLVIVESPTKARTIERMLNKDFRVMASMGHIRDLPERQLGVDVENNFTPMYVDNAKSAKILKDISAAAKNADAIYLAPDPDREGEAIAWHLQEILKKGFKKDFHRITFNEITREAIDEAMANPGKINLDLVDAQQARRILDRLVGYKVSPLLWSKIAKGISAGRVQSVAVRLIVEREREIQDFKPEEYWTFEQEFITSAKEKYRGKLFKVAYKDFKVTSATKAEKIAHAIAEVGKGVVNDVSSTRRKRHAQPPFTTSTLQQAASTSLHFSASNTMRYAQALYEGVDVGEANPVGLITYMRTDSVAIAKSSQERALDYIGKVYGEEYRPKVPNRYKNKAAAQAAHEAIRPTNIYRTPESLKGVLEPNLHKLYTLIWRRAVASQMTPCVQELTSVDTVINGSDGVDYLFRSTASKVVFPGFTTVYSDGKDEEPNADGAVLAKLKSKEEVTPGDLEKKQKFTEPPPHFTEASLIKTLEDNGIGRPSTYAAIIRTIQDRKYVIRNQGKLLPSELGFLVTDFLVEHLPVLFDVDFTALMEQQLDKIEEGTLNWLAMLENFYDAFKEKIERIKADDRPPNEDVEAILESMKDVKFDPKYKLGERINDEGKFFRSLTEQHKKGKPLSARQFSVLIHLAGKYLKQVDSSKLPKHLLNSIAATEQIFLKRLEEAKEKHATPAQSEEYKTLFSAFSKVEWPVANAKSRYDEKKFFDSLAKQAESGRILSHKQLAVIRRMAEKYRDQLTVEHDWIDKFFADELKTDAKIVDPDDKRIEAEKLFEKLDKVTQWAEPVKKGKFTFDDKTFYNSLARQYREGRTLSPKQLAALSKLAKKYLP